MYFARLQVEVVQSAVVTDYSDALLLPNGMIEELNGTIKGSGAQKVSILEEIKAGGKQVRKQGNRSQLVELCWVCVVFV